jgi:S1-C subfamily serine protease
MRRSVLRCLVAASLLLAPAVPARAAESQAVNPLRQYSDSIAALVKRVSPTVVQVLVTGYGPVDNGHGSATDLVFGRQRSLASGVIVDPSGYIDTNAHVVAGARRIEVVLPGSATDVSPIRSLADGRGRALEARVVGVAREVDLALLQVDATGWPALPMADYDALRQGDLVFAFGSPEGLRNSVSMGVVSAVARQPDADHPMVYIQTDAPINHGNSGGPLVNANGELVGINTFIVSESGGSVGLGFAIPSTIVSVASQQLRRFGHLHQGEIGANLQTIPPDHDGIQTFVGFFNRAFEGDLGSHPVDGHRLLGRGGVSDEQQAGGHDVYAEIRSHVRSPINGTETRGRFCRPASSPRRADPGCAEPSPSAHRIPAPASAAPRCCRWFRSERRRPACHPLRSLR